MNWIRLIGVVMVSVVMAGCRVDPWRGRSEGDFLRAIEGTSAVVVARGPGAVAGQEVGGQVVVVLEEKGAGEERGRFVTIAGYERRGVGGAGSGGYVRVVGPYAGVVGAKGFAGAGEKREGDMRTPTGRYSITEMFGEDGEFRPRMKYRVLGELDEWCEDPASEFYNEWWPREVVRARRLAGGSSLRGEGGGEEMYLRGAVIDYNRWPVVKGAGSGIFLHAASADGAGTYGCVGLPRKELDQILRWLDERRGPEVVMGGRDRGN